MKKLLLSLVVFLTLAGTGGQAANNCVFVASPGGLTLSGDCSTDATILLPAVPLVNLGGFTVTAVDPLGDHFRGAVLRNAGTWLAVTNGTVTVSNLANVCDAGDDRLYGILLEGAAGYVTHVTVAGVNQGPSGCQEGNSIAARNAPFDHTHPNTLDVEFAHNIVSDFMKTGILANGDVNASIHHNKVGASMAQANLAANSIQIGFGAIGTVEHNEVYGNQWEGFHPTLSDFAATAMLLYDAGAGTRVSHNRVYGASDLGVYLFANETMVTNNQLSDNGAPDAGYDIGIGNYGTDNLVAKNKVGGFTTPYEGTVNPNNQTKKPHPVK